MGMLTLRRKVLESIHLDIAGVTVIVTVAEIRNGRVGLAFRAPESVRILRSELLAVEKREDDSPADE
jgi:carbon storage regulator CsrA